MRRYLDLDNFILIKVVMFVIYLYFKDRRGWDTVPRIIAASPKCGNLKWQTLKGALTCWLSELANPIQFPRLSTRVLLGQLPYPWTLR